MRKVSLELLLSHSVVHELLEPGGGAQKGRRRGREVERASCLRFELITSLPSFVVKPRMKPPLPESFIYECSTETNTISLGPEHPSNKKRGVIKGREQESEFTVGQYACRAIRGHERMS